MARTPLRVFAAAARFHIQRHKFLRILAESVTILQKVPVY